MRRKIGEIYERHKTITKGKKSIIKTEMYIKTNEGTKLYHRYLVEQYLGFSIPPDMIVHHINYDHSDNQLSNFLLIPTSLHWHIHRCKSKGIFASNLELIKQLFNKE